MTKKIVVIDDEEDYLNLVKTILEPLGYKIIFSSNGTDGLSKIKSDIPDLVILDVNMPEINGYQLCQQIRKTQDIKHIPIILLTVRRKEDDKVKGLELGADDYITKPFHPKELIARVETVLRRSE
ncbi:MAG: response regulator [Elusimicrobiota bacterium]